MGFGKMGHLIKLNIKIDIINQNDQCFVVKWDILCLLQTYLLPPIYNLTSYIPTYEPTHLPRYNAYLPTHAPT
jgi:hypothetical protein